MKLHDLDMTIEYKYKISNDQILFIAICFRLQ